MNLIFLFNMSFKKENQGKCPAPSISQPFLCLRHLFLEVQCGTGIFLVIYDMA